MGRRRVELRDSARWIFNRMADVYAARPPYPESVVDAIARRVTVPGASVGDVGAGLGHLAIPLAARGLSVTAVEPAEAMLTHLRALADARGVSVRCLHGTAEAVPIDDDAFDLVVVADALHFLDAELAGREIGRVLRPGGQLAVLSVDFAPTPYMRALTALLREAAPRRPSTISGRLQQLTALAGVAIDEALTVEDAVPVDPERLERILRSISFVGPAMNSSRWSRFVERVHALEEPAIWARSFELSMGTKRAGSRRSS